MHFSSCFRLFIWMAFLTGAAYPLLATLIAQIGFGAAANGSLITVDGKTAGSLLIAQPFSEERYFWPRPSATHYKIPSGGSNLGPISTKLKEEVAKRKSRFSQSTVPSELVYASGSGLDPHISMETAYFQIPRVAKARGLEESEVKSLVDGMTEHSIFNNPYVNVLHLNMALGNKVKDVKNSK